MSMTIICDGCGRMHRVGNHDPCQADGYSLQCRGCPRRVVIGLTDPIFRGIEETVAQRLEGGAGFYEALMAALSEAVGSCECGECFDVHAPARCHGCKAPIDGQVVLDAPAALVVKPSWDGAEHPSTLR